MIHLLVHIKKCAMLYKIYLPLQTEVKHATYNRMNTQKKAVHYTKILSHSMKVHLQCGEICFVLNMFIQIQFLSQCCEVNRFFQ